MKLKATTLLYSGVYSLEFGVIGFNEANTETITEAEAKIQRAQL